MSVIKRIPIGRNPTDFKQHDLSLGGRCLVLRDHRNSGPGAVSIQNGQVTRADVAGVDFLPSTISVPEGQECPFVHAVCHLDELDRRAVEFFEDRVSASERPKMVILQASTASGGVGWAHETLDRIIWLSMKDKAAYGRVREWLPEFMDLDFATAKLIAGAPDRGSLSDTIQRTCPHLLDITHPGDPTALFAFRLHCEAWEEVNVNGNASLSGFPITAPSGLTDWLAPFSPQSNGDRASIESVVAMMGDQETKTKVRAVLSAAEKSPRIPVLDLLGRPNDAPDTEGDAQ